MRQQPPAGNFPSAYAQAGVDIDRADAIKLSIKNLARAAARPEMLGGIGFFGGLFELGAHHNPVLVSSADGVGTKLKIASSLGKHDTVGIDLVNHCVNDILTCGAEPLFFLDYIGMGKLDQAVVDGLIRGLVSACRATGCALVGGETAEMPGLYALTDYDLVGFIVGVVEKASVINGQGIRPGDVLLGLRSSGLHTNGYSLVRRTFGTERPALDAYYSELGRTLGEELLEPHRCYYPLLKTALPSIKGLAHITGGGLPGNVPRVLPPGLAVRIQASSWTPLPVFGLIERNATISRGEMYRVFNMGVGMVVICSPDNVNRLLSVLPEAWVLGDVIQQAGAEKVIIGE